MAEEEGLKRRIPPPPVKPAPPKVHLRPPSAAGAPGRGMDKEKWRVAQEESRRYVAVFEKLGNALQERMRLLRFLCDLAERPRTEWKPALLTLRPDVANVGAGIMHRVIQDPTVEKRMRIALARFDDAAKLAQMARVFLQTESTFDADDVAGVLEILNRLKTDGSGPRWEILSAFDVRALKAKIYLLTTLDLLFKNDAILNQIFPLQERKPKEEAPKPERKQAPPPEPEPPAPKDSLLGGIMKRLKRGPPDP